MADKNEILLESGTNEIEIMEFTIAGSLYGINVAKVDEIMLCQPVKAMPHTHPAVEGIFKPRETVITVLNLPRYLGFESELQEKDLFIITNFNNMHIAFRVHTVIGISRISWTAIQKPDKAISGKGESVATGIAQCNGELVTILDFERVVAEIAPETSIQISEIEQMGPRRRNNQPILLADDSILLSEMIKEALTKAGYTNLKQFSNGLELWEYLSMLKKTGQVEEKAALIITDLEMPQMDGHRLTKLVKEDEVLRHIPLIIFSSLISDEMRVKGKELGADEQMSKPEIGHLVSVMDRLLDRAG
ncbi:MAG: chemotaxis protein CheV [Oscillospiraceae bacterium]|nr:chemotaxis protein CheV [Oscillospiraceae bacterium]